MVKKIVFFIIILCPSLCFAIDVDVDDNTSIDITYGGTNAATAAGARTNLGLVIGTDVLAPDGDGSALTGVTTTETDPIVGAINGIVEADGAGTISAATSISSVDLVLGDDASTTEGDIGWDGVNDVLEVGDGAAIQPVVMRNVDQGIWQSVAISPAAMIADGTNATDPASEAINGGPNVWFSTVSDAAGTLEFSIPMPENWDGGNIYVEMVAGSNEATPAGTVEFEVQAMARGAGDVINATWLSTVNCQFGSSMDTQYAVEIAESAVIACSGLGGDMLYVKLTRDSDDGANDTSTQAVEVWGARVYYQIDDMDERD